MYLEVILLSIASYVRILKRVGMMDTRCVLIQMAGVEAHCMCYQHLQLILDILGLKSGKRECYISMYTRQMLTAWQA